MAGYIGSKASVTSSGAERKKTFAITTNTTSLTGLSYTVGQVHVFHNGVRLVDGTDYTATNGTSITLTSAAENGDEVVVISYATFQTSDTVSASAGGTFAGDVNFSGSFTSQGIDDNATSTAMTLDTSGNVLVGKTVANTTTLGNTVYAGIVSATMSGDPAIFANRAQDGSIIELQKNGTTAGSIGVINSNNLTINGTASNHTGLQFGTSIIWPMRDSANADGTVDLGTTSGRFKDLYLSGGVYLGGVGASNKLDDYETGTFSPAYEGSASNPTVTYVSANTEGHYTKIGNVVYCSVEVRTSSYTGGAGDLKITGLPFTVKNNSALSQGAITLYNINFDPAHHITVEPQGNTTFAFIRLSVDSTISANLSATSGSGVINTFPALIRFSVTYLTDS